MNLLRYAQILTHREREREREIHNWYRFGRSNHVVFTLGEEANAARNRMNGLFRLEPGTTGRDAEPKRSEEIQLDVALKIVVGAWLLSNDAISCQMCRASKGLV